MNAMKLVAIGLMALALGAGEAWSASATRTSSFEYDPASGFLTKEVIEPGNANLCLVTTYAYNDPFGNKTGATTSNCTGASGDAVIEARTSTTIYAAGTQTVVGTLSWSAGQFPTTSTNALNHSEAKEFDPRFGAVTKLTGPNGLVTIWSYDGFGRKTLEVRSDGNKTEWAYFYCSGFGTPSAACPAGLSHARYFVQTTPKNSAGAQNGPISKVYYDALNREIRSETQGFNGTLVFRDTEYDPLGRVFRVSKPYYAGQPILWTTFTYDPLGRVLTETQPTTSSGTVRTTTDYNGLITTVTVSNNGSGTNLPQGLTQSKTTTRNSQGQTKEVADTQGNTIIYTYDPFGSLLTTNAGGVITSMTPDLRGRKTAMAEPNMGNWTYGYNALGELVRQTDAKFQVTTMRYDKLGRMTNRTEPDLISNWFYDTVDGTPTGATCGLSKGKLCKVTSDNGYLRTYSYDSQGRRATVSVTIGTVFTATTAYDANGRVSTLTYPTGAALKYVHNSFGYLSEVRDNSDNTLVWQAQTVSASGKVTKEFLKNGLTTSRTYDELERLRGVVTSGTAGTVQNSTYDYDTIGNLKQRVDVTQANLTENFSYDRLNRLTMASGPGMVTRAYEYNAIGNITYNSGTNYGYGAKPHAVTTLTGAFNQTLSYDANGNFFSGAGRTIGYTSFNMPSSLQYNGNTFQYTYNAEHERVRLAVTRPTGTTTTIYVHPDGSENLLFEQDTRPDGTLEYRHFVHGGSGLIGVYVTKSVYGAGDGPSPRYFHRDHLGSVQVVTNSAGAVIERLAYEAFGKRRFPNGADDPNNSLAGASTDRGFTGHEHLDELAFIHMNGRIYSPELGRFLSADPLIQAAGNLQSYNRYSYGLNNPLSGVDPSGYGFFSKLWRSVVRPAIAFAVGNAICGPWCGAAAMGAVNGYSQTHNLRGALIGTVNGLVSHGIGLNFPIGDGAGGIDLGNLLTNATLHGARACAVASAQGGSCGPSATAAFMTSALGPASDNLLEGGGPVAQLAGRAVIGGIGSVAAGGRFEDGVREGFFESITNGLHGPFVQYLSQLGTRLHNVWLRFWPEITQGVEIAAGEGPGVYSAGGRAIGSTNDLLSASRFDRILRHGEEQRFIQGDAEAIFQSVTRGYEQLAPGRARGPDGEFVTLYRSSSRGVMDLQVNRAATGGNIYKIRVEPSLVDQIPK